MEPSNIHVDRLRQAAKDLIRDQGALDNIRLKYGAEFLKESTLKNWKSRADGTSIKDRTLEGAILGWACHAYGYLQRYEGTPSSQPQPVQESFDDELRDVPESIRAEHPGAVRQGGLWARRMLNIVSLDPLAEEPNQIVGTIWRFWEGVHLLRSRQSSHLFHGSQFEIPRDPSQLPPWVSQEKIPADSAGVLTTKLHNGTILFSQEVLHAGNPSSPADGESFGYKFNAPWVFAEGPDKNVEHEVFGGQSCIPCESVELLVSLPPECLEFDAGWPYLKAYSFATIPSLSRLDYFRQVVEKSRGDSTPEEERQKSALNALWADQRTSVAKMLSNVETIQAPALLKETVGGLFSGQKRVFHTRFETPNPLTTQAVCWKRPMG